MTTPDFSTLNQGNIVAFIGDIFDRCGDAEYLGEPVTMEQHMLQGATLAERNGLPEDIIVGALLHDIGHFHVRVRNLRHGRYRRSLPRRSRGAGFGAVLPPCHR